MKKSALILSINFFLLYACNSKQELDPSDALIQIRQERNFPGVLDYDIYCADPKYGRKVLDAGLESEGLVIVLRTQKLMDAGTALIKFTSKAQAYMLPTSQQDKIVQIQKVKLADVDVVEVSNLSKNVSGNKAIVDYATAFKNLTPFAKLITIDFSKRRHHKAYFILGTEGWKLEKKPN